MKIGIICGSNRQNSESKRVSHIVSEKFQEIGVSENKQVSTDIFSLDQLEIPLWSEKKVEKNNPEFISWGEISNRLSLCTGFVVVTPEWGGMVTPHLKNLFLMCSNGELAHKPALIVAVSAGAGGSNPVAELRMSGYKNTYIWWLPDHIIIRRVKSFCKEDSRNNSDDVLLTRIEYCLKFLLHTSLAVTPVRESLQDLKTYPYGM